MHMFCFQCQETSDARGCTFGGHCGKTEETANFQDLLIYVLKGIGVLADRLALAGSPPARELGELAYEALFMTITNTNFRVDRIIEMVQRLLSAKRMLMAQLKEQGLAEGLSEIARWDALTTEAYTSKAYGAVSYTHLRAHETVLDLVCRLLLEKKK